MFFKKKKELTNFEKIEHFQNELKLKEDYDIIKKLVDEIKDMATFKMNEELKLGYIEYSLGAATALCVGGLSRKRTIHTHKYLLTHSGIVFVNYAYRNALHYPKQFVLSPREIINTENYWYIIKYLYEIVELLKGE